MRENQNMSKRPTTYRTYWQNADGKIISSSRTEIRARLVATSIGSPESVNSLEYLEQSRQILRRLLSATWPKYCNTLLSPQTYLETLEGNISKFLIYTRKNVETNTK